MDKWMAKFQSELEWFTQEPVANKVKAVILDTGIDATHPDIQKLWRIPNDDDSSKESWLARRYWDFTTDRDDGAPNPLEPPQDACGHGTHTAGIFLQLAPNVDLYVARVMKGATVGTDSGVIAQRISNVSTPPYFPLPEQLLTPSSFIINRP